MKFHITKPNEHYETLEADRWTIEQGVLKIERCTVRTGAPSTFETVVAFAPGSWLVIRKEE